MDPSASSRAAEVPAARETPPGCTVAAINRDALARTVLSPSSGTVITPEETVHLRRYYGRVSSMGIYPVGMKYERNNIENSTREETKQASLTGRSLTKGSRLG